MKNARERAMIRAAVAISLSVVALGALAPLPARADGPLSLSFVSDGTFFSQEAKVERAIDPQIFVRDAAAAQGTGPESIEHVAGLRNARLDDSPDAATYNAEGASLALSFGHWVAARGTLAMTAHPDGNTSLVASFSHLVAFGEYSLFVATDRAGGTTYRPLDGDGTINSFAARADGSAGVVIDVPAQLTHDDAVVLIYHSDGREHGASRGRIGVTAHQQLAVRVP